MASHSEAGRAVVVAPRDARGRPGARLVALIRSDIRRVVGGELARAVHPTAKKPAKVLTRGNAAGGLIAGEEIALARCVPQAHVQMRARAGVLLVPLSHERHRFVMRISDLLSSVLVDNMAIGLRHNVAVL